MSGGGIDWQVARRCAREAGDPLPAVDLPLGAAIGAVLAGPLVALSPLPAYDAAAMDGYAVAGPGPWRIVGRVLAGDPQPPPPLSPGTATEIATGAVVPAGAEAVLPYERSTRTGGLTPGSTASGEVTPGPTASGEVTPGPTASGEVTPGPTASGEVTPGPTASGEVTPGPTASGEVTPGPTASGEVTPGPTASGEVIPGPTVSGEFLPGRHVRRRGEDCPAGQAVLPAGTVVGPVVLGLAAGLGHDTLAVHRRPRVGVVVTGAEVCRSGIPAAGRVRDAIGPMLPGLIRDAGGEPAWESRVADDPAALVGSLLRSDADVLVVCGATSAGAADHLRGALDTVAARVLVRGVACRPGHPQLFAALPDGRFVVGLPGNPYAALVAALTLLSPLLGRLAGRAEPPMPTATLTGPVTPHDRDTRLVPVTRIGSLVVPVGHDRPGSLWGAAGAEALAVVPPGWTGGDVGLLPLPTGTPPVVTVPATEIGRPMAA
jgi:molybdopterin molybdotransferase